MKKPVFLWLTLLSSLLVAVFLIWALAQHGTVGLIRLNGIYKAAFIGLGAIAVIAPLVAFAGRYIKLHGKVFAGRALAVAALIFSLPGLLGSPAALVVLSGVLQRNIGDTPPQLFITPSTGARGLPDLAVTFNTAGVTSNTVAWGKVLGADAGATITEPAAARVHAFLLRDLEPGTAYYYRVNSGATYIFHTTALDGNLHFAVGSDVHYGASGQRGDLTAKLLEQIASTDNKFGYFFMNGDVADWGFDKGMYREAFTGLAAATSVIPARIIVGNHDTMFSGFGNYLSVGYPGGLPLDGGSKLWSRIDVGNVHFLLIDLEWSAESFTDEQAAWLETELQTIPSGDWKIVLGHGFTYASGLEIDGWHWYDNPETIAKLVPLYEKYGVDLVFAGHDHISELLQKGGVTYIVTGAFGGLPDAGRTYTSPYSVWYRSGLIDFLDVTITGNQATLIFRAPDGSEIYRQAITRT